MNKSFKESLKDWGHGRCHVHLIGYIPVFAVGGKRNPCFMEDTVSSRKADMDFIRNIG